MGNLVYNWIERYVLLKSQGGDPLKLKLNKNNIRNNYEFRFYKYLTFIFIILFSCIITVSNLTNFKKVRKLIADEVRIDYNDFFDYEIENSNDGLEKIYSNYSNISRVPIEKLIAINVIYYCQDNNMYLEPYMRSYVDNKYLSKDEKKELYIAVDKEIKRIENIYTVNLMFKRFSPYILSIIFVTFIMCGISLIKNLSNREKIFLGILVFVLGIYICYISFYSLGSELLISLSIIGSVFEFAKNIDCDFIKNLRFIFLVFIVFIFIFVGNENIRINNIGNYNSNDILMINNLKKVSCSDDTDRYKRLGLILFSELNKTNLIEINENKEYIDNLIKSKNKITFIDRRNKNVICYVYFYENMPTYRLIYFENNSNRKLYEGVLNPYMRSIIIKLNGKEKYRDNRNISYYQRFKFV